MRLLLDRQRAGMRILLVAGLLAVGLSWAKVVSTIHGAKPAAAPGQPLAIVWAGHVFGSRHAITSWLSARGVRYTAWRAAHPEASAVLEHTSTQTPRRATATVVTHRKEPTSSSNGAASALATARAAPSTSGQSIAGTTVLALLALISAACAVAAGLPTAILYRYPALGRRVGPRRDLLLAGAAALGVGIALGIAWA